MKKKNQTGRSRRYTQKTRRVFKSLTKGVRKKDRGKELTSGGEKTGPGIGVVNYVQMKARTVVPIVALSTDSG